MGDSYSSQSNSDKRDFFLERRRMKFLIGIGDLRWIGDTYGGKPKRELKERKVEGGGP